MIHDSISLEGRQRANTRGGEQRGGGGNLAPQWLAPAEHSLAILRHQPA